MTYDEALSYAIDNARTHRCSYGIEKNRYYSGGFGTPFMLPRPENRFGHELRCEVVDPGMPHSDVTLAISRREGRTT